MWNIDYIFEFKYSNNKWYSRKLQIANYEVYKLYCGIRVFDFELELKGFKRNQKFVTSTCLVPNEPWDSIQADFKKLDVLNLKDQKTSDCYDGMMVDDGVQYYIEIATRTKYKFIFWDNPRYTIEKTLDVKNIVDFTDMIYGKFSECRSIPSIKYDQNRWP